MSVRICRFVWEDLSLATSEKIVLLSLADHADDDGNCYPSMPRLAALTGMSERGIQKVVKRLCNAGKLEISSGGGRGKSNRYRVVASENPEPGSVIKVTNPEPETPNTGAIPRTTFGDTKPETPNQSAETPNQSAINPEPRSGEPPRTTKEPPNARDELCKIVSPDVADDFIAHRREIKKPLTPRGAAAIAKKLRGRKDAAEILQDSIANGWQGVFPDKRKSQKSEEAWNEWV